MILKNSHHWCEKLAGVIKNHHGEMQRTNFVEAQTYEKYLLNQTNFDLTLPEERRAQAKLAVKDEERTLCGALMVELQEVLKETKYFVDVEYNRNIGGTLKTLKKTIRDMDEQIVIVNCDLIVHSRGQNVFRDNLIALEMKKSIGRQIDKDSDRNRLECLTKSPEQDVWSCGARCCQSMFLDMDWVYVMR